MLIIGRKYYYFISKLPHIKISLATMTSSIYGQRHTKKKKLACHMQNKNTTILLGDYIILFGQFRATEILCSAHRTQMEKLKNYNPNLKIKIK
jgi:hypothetical protein